MDEGSLCTSTLSPVILLPGRAPDRAAGRGLPEADGGLTPSPRPFPPDAAVVRTATSVYFLSHLHTHSHNIL